MKRIIFLTVSVILMFIVSDLCVNITSACDVAVISGKVTANGRPVLWKNRDHELNWMQEVTFNEGENPEVGGSIRVIDWSLIISVITSGGINEAGFAITNATVYDDNFIHDTITNADTEIVEKALKVCKTVGDFENLLDHWHEDPANNYKMVSSNFAVIDAHGGAAVYEAFTGLGYETYTSKIDYIKFDANTAEKGFINRTNHNSLVEVYIDENSTIREGRASDILSDLLEEDRLDYVSVMQELAKDVCGDVERDGNGDFLDTKNCISRAITNLSFVVDGVSAGSDPKFSTFWCNLGEPAVGIFVPYFPAAKKIPFYAWAEDDEKGMESLNITPYCLLNKAISDMELVIYEHNDRAFISNTDYSNMEFSIFEQNDLSFILNTNYSMNYEKLLGIQAWIVPLENTLIEKTEEYLDKAFQNELLMTSENLLDFSLYCSEFAYKNYIHESDSYMAWDYKIPVQDSTSDQEEDEPLSWILSFFKLLFSFF